MTVDKKQLSLKGQIPSTSIYRWIALACLLGSSSIQAQTASLLMTPDQRQLIDAERQAYLTQPVATKAEKPKVKTESPGLVEQEETLLVSAILKKNGRKQAQINGVIYKESESKRGIQVHYIGDQTITLTANGKWGRAKIGVLYDLKDWPNSPESKVKATR